MDEVEKKVKEWEERKNKKIDFSDYLYKKDRTLKDCIEYLSKIYKYVRVIQLKNTMILTDALPHTKYPFNKMVIASNELKMFDDEDTEIKKVNEKVNVLIQKGEALMQLYEIFFGENQNIPVFILEKREKVEES